MAKKQEFRRLRWFTRKRFSLGSSRLQPTERSAREAGPAPRTSSGYALRAFFFAGARRFGGSPRMPLSKTN